MQVRREDKRTERERGIDRKGRGLLIDYGE